MTALRFQTGGGETSLASLRTQHVVVSRITLQKPVQDASTDMSKSHHSLVLCSRRLSHPCSNQMTQPQNFQHTSPSVIKKNQQKHQVTGKAAGPFSTHATTQLQGRVFVLRAFHELGSGFGRQLLFLRQNFPLAFLPQEVSEPPASSQKGPVKLHKQPEGTSLATHWATKKKMFFKIFFL